MTELTEHIKVKSSSAASSTDDEEEGVDAQFVQFFPNFVWAVRDFTLHLNIDGKDVTADQYLEHSLELKKGCDKKTMNFNLPRECIRNYFPTRKCFVFPTPTSPENMAQLESMDVSGLCQGFIETTDTFCNYVFQRSHVKTLKGGEKVTGRMLGHLITMYVETISKGGVPCLENAVLAMAQIENQAALEEGLMVYLSGMEQVKTKFPVDMDQMSDHHFCSEQQAIKQFMNCSFKDENGHHLKNLKMGIEEHYTALFCQNEEASVKKCQDLLKDLAALVTQKIQGGFYAKPGGYELYCNDHNSVVAQYRSTPNKGVQAEVVLELFLKEKSVESCSILQADKNLTEKEKEIHEETNRATLAEQKQKVELEKQQQLEREMQEKEKSHQEMMHQLKAKMELDAEKMKHEMKMAMESKLEEQKRLHKKGHLEKETIMKEEINSLKQKMEKAKRVQEAHFYNLGETIMSCVSESLGCYFNYKEARENRKALHYKLRASRQNTMNDQ